MTTIQSETRTRGRQLPYEAWVRTLGIPIYGGHSVEAPLTLELGWWESRGCNVAIISLEGQKGVSEARITEVPPGMTLPAQRYAFAEVVYVLNGHGMTTVWDDHARRRTFEWQPRSLFCLPRHCHHQVANARGDRPARLLHYNYLPMAMSAIPEPEFFFDNPFAAANPLVGLEESFSEAKVLVDPDEEGGRWRGGRAVWAGNFFPDMQAWDKLIPYRGRGAGGRVVWIQFPRAEMGAHMSVFDSQKYKKGHKHGPGRVIVIPKGEGYSVLWPEGGEKIVCPWKEATIFVPPENWYHQHFNVGNGEARYLALGPAPQFRGTNYRHQIEYPDEDPWIRAKFSSELAKHGLKSLMPDECYKDRDFEWDYGDDD